MIMDALVGETIKITLEKVLSFAADQVALVFEFKEDLERLVGTVQMIVAFVDDAEEKKLKDQAVNLWLKKLEELACHAEHVLDEVNYEMLRCIVEDQYTLKGKVRFSKSHNYSSIFRWRMARKIRDINDRFELINKEARGFGLQYRMGAGAASTATLFPTNYVGPSRETDSIVRQRVIGRNNDASKIVEKLLSPSDELSFISITGMGGSGKTTLAQFVYNDELIVKNFGKRIWVCVSENFEPKRILKLILESLTKSSEASLDGKDTLVQKIKEKLGDERYLLVLDDVWSKNNALWDGFLRSIAGISTTPGNWIIVTTRELQVASNLPAVCNFSLGKLSNEDCLHIVKEKALPRGEGIQEFEVVIREKIVRLCQGLPLVASVIGGLLLTNPKKEWLSVLQKGISSMSCDENSGHVMQVIKLSFDHLPFPSIKKCFAYCSLFEKDTLMEKQQLIELWMAEGFLEPKFGNEMEIGNHYINILLNSSLLQEVINTYGESKCVRMHDLIHDLALLISKSANDPKDLSEVDTKTLEKMSNLRTLFLPRGVPTAVLMQFQHLHVLNLSKVDSHKLPSSIGKLIHLRYLDISRSRIKALAKSLCKLYNLQTLRIENCCDLRALPEGATKLISLRHLHCDSHLEMPPNMGRLKNLQTLKVYRIGREKGYQIKELGCLEHLRGGLTIHNLERVITKEEALQAGLFDKPNIDTLEFYFSYSRGRENQENVLDGLQPHPNLQVLSVHSFSGNQFPLWLMNMTVGMGRNLELPQKLDKLTSLSLLRCGMCTQLPALGQLPSLKYLWLEELNKISCIEASFYGTRSEQVPQTIFPALRHLKVANMLNLEEWMEPETAKGEVVEMFPNLVSLIVRRCVELRRAPIHLFPSLKRLEINSTGFEQLLPAHQMDQNYTRYPPNFTHKGIPTLLESLEIKWCDNLTEFPAYLYDFQFLQTLEIEGCSNLRSFPPLSGEPRLVSLQKLSITKCKELTTLPADLLESCPRLHTLCLFWLRNLEWFPFDLQVMPSLSSLELYEVPKLMTVQKKLSYYCSRLSTLSIGELPNPVKFDWSATPSWSSICTLKLINWPHLVSLPDQLQHLPGLRELWLWNLPKIEALPDWFGKLVSLEKLGLYYCYNLCCLPSAAAMKSLIKLSSLTIETCPFLKQSCSQRTENSEWYKISHIPDITIDSKRIWS